MEVLTIAIHNSNFTDENSFVTSSVTWSSNSSHSVVLIKLLSSAKTAFLSCRSFFGVLYKTFLGSSAYFHFPVTWNLPPRVLENISLISVINGSSYLKLIEQPLIRLLILLFVTMDKKEFLLWFRFFSRT